MALEKIKYNLSPKDLYIGMEFPTFIINNIVKGEGKNKNRTYILCECKCGNFFKTDWQSIRSGHTRSCGCIQKSNAGKQSKEKLWTKDCAFNRVYNSYKTTANTKGYAFNLTKEEFRAITSKPCTYCGMQNSLIKTCKINDYLYNGIDRVDNNIGYFLENCVPCCTMCNYMKKSYSLNEFLNHIKRIFVHNFKNEIFI